MMANTSYNVTHIMHHEFQRFLNWDGMEYIKNNESLSLNFRNFCCFYYYGMCDEQANKLAISYFVSTCRDTCHDNLSADKRFLLTNAIPAARAVVRLLLYHEDSNGTIYIIV